ncbi:MAG: histidine kinase [Saprospiraceae bacterium]|nr:histidine kinase [Candidatus Opimibacter skivensis]
MPIKRYSSKEPVVFVWIITPYIVFMNLLIFGTCIFGSIGCFFKSFLTSAAYFFIIYAVFGSLAVIIKNRNPGAGDLFKRVRLMLPFFYLMNIGAVYGAFYIFRHVINLGCVPLTGMVWWTILYGCIMSTVITFINEGMANWENWKNSLSESEKLKNAYQRSKLLGLKGQINPHFLFNCFNTLSGLIQENEEEAEKFLDEMTKVHRYLLRGDDEYLVPLADEMKFAAAYLYLTKARFGNAIVTEVNVPKSILHKLIPPLSMQVILENIIYTNALSKKEPLQISITGDSNGRLIIKHSLHEKIIVQNLSLDEGLDNLITKYRLMNMQEVEVTETEKQRIISLPLFESETTFA